MEDDKKVIPPLVSEAPSEAPVDAEDIAFDKADRAEKIENEKQKLIKEIQELESALKKGDGDDKDRIKTKIAEDYERLKVIEQTEAESRPEDRNVEEGVPAVADKPHR